MKTQKLLSLAAIAALITSAYGSVTIDWVTVGNSGNATDPLTGYGAVAYEYKIGKYEVTNVQYGEFLNAVAKTDSYGLYNSSHVHTFTRSGNYGSYTYSVTTALANRPVTCVSWYDAARFANWIHNGQGSGSTETGAYALNGASPNALAIILANAGAQVYIPTENEWYKAAYYNSANQSYSLYPNGKNTITTADANYGRSDIRTTDVGTYSHAPSSYGTFDQGGNVIEWIDGAQMLRGGAWGHNVDTLHSATSGNSASPTLYNDYIGFRLASVPEPSSLVLTMLASGVVLLRRKR